MKIKLMTLGTQAREADVPVGTSIQGALESHNYPLEGYSISKNGVGASLAAEVSEGDVILLSPKVTGGL